MPSRTGGVNDPLDYSQSSCKILVASSPTSRLRWRYAFPCHVASRLPPQNCDQDMNKSEPSDRPVRPPTCAACGEPMFPCGQIVDLGTYKKWVDEWRCPVHGPFAPGLDE